MLHQENVYFLYTGICYVTYFPKKKKNTIPHSAKSYTSRAFVSVAAGCSIPEQLEPDAYKNINNLKKKKSHGVD